MWTLPYTLSCVPTLRWHNPDSCNILKASSDLTSWSLVSSLPIPLLQVLPSMILNSRLFSRLWVALVIGSPTCFSLSDCQPLGWKSHLAWDAPLMLWLWLVLLWSYSCSVLTCFTQVWHCMFNCPYSTWSQESENHSFLPGHVSLLKQRGSRMPLLNG